MEQYTQNRNPVASEKSKKDKGLLLFVLITVGITISLILLLGIVLFQKSNKEVLHQTTNTTSTVDLTLASSTSYVLNTIVSMMELNVVTSENEIKVFCENIGKTYVPMVRESNGNITKLGYCKDAIK